MPIPDAFIAFADHFGLKDSETFSEILRMLYDHEEDLVLLPALPGTVKEVSDKTGIAEQHVKDPWLQNLRGHMSGKSTRNGEEGLTPIHSKDP